MTKFRQLEPIQIPPDDPNDLDQVGMRGGLRTDVNPRELVLSEAVDIEDLRFEGSSLRKDFGDRSLGSGAGTRILGLVEHKSITGEGERLEEVIRITRTTDGRVKTEIWNSISSAWDADAETVVQTIDDEYVRAISVQGVLLIAACGSPVLARTKDVEAVPEFDDFPPGNSLTAVGNITTLTLTPTTTILADTITVYNSVALTLTTGTNLNVTIEFLHNAVVVAERSFLRTVPGSVSFAQHLTLDGLGFDSGDTIAIRIKSISTDEGNSREASPFTDNGPGPAPRWEVTKGFAPESEGDIYTFNYTISVEPGGTVTVGYYFDEGAGWVKHSEETFPSDTFEDVSRDRLKTGMGATDRFGVHIENTTGAGGGFVGNTPDSVTWEAESGAAFSVDVHGFNLPTDGDANHGVEYNTPGPLTVALAPVDGAPEASWIESFADRVIALQDKPDPQMFSASQDGNVLQWSLDTLLFPDTDAVRTALVDTRSDALDDLQCAAPLAANVLVVLRKRSIMRAFETNNPALAVGVQHWLEGVGTESPFSIAITPLGAVFLGHDLMVYLLSASGLTEIGNPIQEDLVRLVTSNIKLVDGVYDPVYREYLLGVPEDGSANISVLYAFDLGELIDNQVIRWRKRRQIVQRLATVSQL